MSPMFSFLIRPCWDSLVTFCSLITYVKFDEVSFGDQNVCAHSLIATTGIRCKTMEKDYMHRNVKKRLA